MSNLKLKNYKKRKRANATHFLDVNILAFIRKEGLSTSQLIEDLLNDFLDQNYGPKYQLYLNQVIEADKADKENKIA